MLQPIEFASQRETFGIVQYPVKHGGCKHRVTHHFSPLRDLLIRCKYNRGCLVGIADEGEEPVGLTASDWGIANFINDDHLSLSDIP